MLLQGPYKARPYVGPAVHTQLQARQSARLNLIMRGYYQISKNHMTSGAATACLYNYLGSSLH